MNDDIRDIAQYYDTEAQREHTRLERHQLEHELTWRYLERYLPPGGRILEIGAATGQYTLELARRGYEVTAVDLSAAELDVNRQRLAEAGLARQARLVQADARSLEPVTEGGFEAALLMGPLYHLVFEADRKTALQAVYDRLQPGGLIFSAFISRLGILGDLMKNVPDWIEDQAEVRSILEVGRDPEHYPGEGFRGYFARVDEIAPLHESLGFTTLALAAVEPAIAADDESYNVLPGPLRQRWLDLLFEVSREPSILAASRHLLYIGQKAA